MLDDNKILKSIRRGLMITIPIIMVGSFVNIFLNFPLAAYQDFIHNWLGENFIRICQLIIFACFDLYSLVLVCTISYSYARQYLDQVPSTFVVVLISLLAFVICVCPKDFDIMEHFEVLGIQGIVTAILVGIVAPIIFKIAYSIRFLRLERSVVGVNNVVRKAVGCIIPTTLVFTSLALVNVLVSNIFEKESISDTIITFQNYIYSVATNNIIYAIIFVLVVHLLIFIGIYGSHVVTQVVTVMYLSDISISVVQETAIKSVDGILSNEFINVYVLTGGCGALICLAIGIIIFSRQRSVRSLNKVSFIATCFNANEIILYGVPVMGNMNFIIPFMLVPVLFLLTSYTATRAGLVPGVIHAVNWATPVFVNGYMATESVAAVILQMFNVFLGVLIYMPFIRKNDANLEATEKSIVKQMQTELQAAEKNGTQVSFITRDGELGDTARKLIKDLEYAIVNKQLELYYQPQISSENVCIGVEALLRWKHQIAGYIYPPLIVELAKESELLGMLEAWIFDRACENLKYINDTVSPDMKMSVNITGKSLYNNNLEKIIDDAVEKYGVDRTKLWIEITEQDAISMTDEISNRLMALKDKGHRLLIDDFGMGHTSLLYLQTNKFDVVKLDGSITEDVMTNERNCQIISSISYLAKSMKFDIVAEYVETEAQRKKLETLDCNTFQGYLYSKPVKVDEFVEWVKAKGFTKQNK